MRSNQPKKKGRFSKAIVVVIITANVMFTVAVLYVFLRTAAEPDSLILAWFGFTMGELWALSGIKKAKEGKRDE